MANDSALRFDNHDSIWLFVFLNRAHIDFWHVLRFVQPGLPDFTLTIAMKTRYFSLALAPEIIQRQERTELSASPRFSLLSITKTVPRKLLLVGPNRPLVYHIYLMQGQEGTNSMLASQ